MKSNKIVPATLLALTGWLGCAGGAGACEVIMKSSGYMTGTESFSDTFDLASAGTLIVTLSDLGHDNFSDFGVYLSQNGKAITPDFGPGVEYFHVGEGPITVNWDGTVDQGKLKGWYKIKVQFTDRNISPVPLPTSAGLLASGIVVLFALGRRRRPSPAVPV